MKDRIVEKIIRINDQPIDELFRQPGKIYTFLNPVSYLDAIRNKALFSEFDGIFSDGGLLVKAIRLGYGKKVERRSFDMTSLASVFFQYAQQNKKRVYIIASKEHEVQKAIGVFQENYPELNIVGYRNGYFSSADEKQQAIDTIIRLKPDYVIVGMGAIAQEKFLIQLRDSGFPGVGFTCGGFIHQVANNEITYYPQWINTMNLRFVYRFYKEKHTRKRYFQAAFLFPVKFLMEKF